MIPVIVLLVVVLVYLVMAILILQRAYFVVGVDQAAVRTGVGPADVRVGGGMLAYPVIHRLELISLIWQPIEIPFVDQPVHCSDGQLHATFTVWIAVDTTHEAILEAAQDFGSQAGEASQIQKLYSDPVRHVITATAKKLTVAAILEHAPEIPRELYQGIEGVLEACHVLHRATMQPIDSRAN